MIRCLACEQILKGEYTYNGIPCTQDEKRIRFDSRYLCEDCYSWMQRRGWVLRELPGKMVELNFIDHSVITVSQQRMKYIDMTLPWQAVKKEAQYYSRLNDNVIHLVKMYSLGPDVFQRRVAYGTQLRMPV